MSPGLPKNMADPTQDVTSKPPEGAGGSGEGPSPKQPRNGMKLGIIVGVIAAVLIVAGAGFAYAHEQPWFCNFACHTPMDPALETFNGVSGEPGVDKFGNVVEDAGDMLIVAHKEGAGMVCTDCHESVIAQQIQEGLHWVPGDYLYPLEERSLTALNGYGQNETPEGFCLNENCHAITRDELAVATASMGERNPHVIEVNHEAFECSDCHKVHRQSVMYCSACHDDAVVPDGWLSFDEAAELTGDDQETSAA